MRLLLSFGRGGDLRGHGRVYIAGFVVFVIGSALCAFAGKVGQLIAFRGVQALGGAMLFATSPAILTGSFPAAERGRVLGLQATLTYLGLTAGPSVGGWLARQYGWQAIFLFNVPAVLLALGLSLRFVPIWRRHFLVWRKLTVRSILGNLADPLIYMLGFGFGLGALLPPIQGMSYIAFITSTAGRSS